MDAITQWLANGAPYEEGVSIYASLPQQNKFLLLNFRKKQTQLLHDKLKYELEKVLQSVVPVVTKAVLIATKPAQSITQHIEQEGIKEATKQAVFFHELPQELRPVLLEANALFREMCFLKVELNELPAHSEKKALEIQISISTKQKKNAACWKKIDYWKQHKIAPKLEVSEFSKLTPAELLRKEQYLFAAISKLNKRLVDNRTELLTTTSLRDHNRLTRAIEKQEGNLIVKNDELLQIKRLIHGE